MKKYQSIPGTDLHKQLWLYFDRIEMAREALKRILGEYGIAEWMFDERSPIEFPQAFRFGDNPVPDFFVPSEGMNAYFVEASSPTEGRSSGASLFMRRLLEIRHIAHERNLLEILAFEPYRDSDGNLVFSPKATKPSSWDGVFVIEIDDDYAGHIHPNLSLQPDSKCTR